MFYPQSLQDGVTIYTRLPKIPRSICQLMRSRKLDRNCFLSCRMITTLGFFRLVFSTRFIIERHSRVGFAPVISAWRHEKIFYDPTTLVIGAKQHCASTYARRYDLRYIIRIGVFSNKDEKNSYPANIVMGGVIFVSYTHT